MRNQRAFKDPTESEIDQIAEWLRPDTYEAVLEGIRRPRPEGSTVSRKPFELVWVLRPDRSIANVDRAKFGLVNDMTVGARPLGVGFAPDGKTLCVANGLESCYGPRHDNNCRKMTARMPSRLLLLPVEQVSPRS